ncbi:ABC transporter permease [Gephyromycinifex aptenodytis]|uniref:ABC transporter permease n=1 Tax=Gephyromycinifex aptenodytis TaxID=2716227 RepID=UPI00144898BB|nr:ABC transporter permease [Gephyromycinifex aptenodytis]
MTARTAPRGANAADNAWAAPPARRIGSHARFETGVLLRNGEQLLVAIVLPALALFALLYAPVPGFTGSRRIDLAMPGILALAVISTAFTGQAISVGFDRRYGVLRLLGTTPLGRDGLLAAKGLAVLVVEAIQVLVLGGLGLILGWRPNLLGLLSSLPLILLGTWAFVALALLLAGTMRAEAVLALANLIWVLLLGAGGVILPTSTMPAPLSKITTFLPSGALGDGLRTALTTGTLDLGALLVLTVWAVLATLLAARVFRWSD